MGAEGAAGGPLPGPGGDLLGSLGLRELHAQCAGWRPPALAEESEYLAGLPPGVSADLRREVGGGRGWDLAPLAAQAGAGGGGGTRRTAHLRSAPSRRMSCGRPSSCRRGPLQGRLTPAYQRPLPSGRRSRLSGGSGRSVGGAKKRQSARSSVTRAPNLNRLVLRGE